MHTHAVTAPQRKVDLQYDRQVANFLGRGTKKLNEQSRPCGILRETQSLELLTEDDVYFLSDMKARI